MPSPANPSPAYKRFDQSMKIDYSAWKNGTPYDIAVLAKFTPEERDLLTDELCKNHRSTGATSKPSAPWPLPKR
jgi:hypothetical protein